MVEGKNNKFCQKGLISLEFLSLGLLKQARKQSGLSVENAASVVQRDKSYIWRIENGSTDIKLKSLLALLHAYGVSVTDVFRKQEAN